MKKIYFVLCLLLSLYYQNSGAQSKSSLQGKIVSSQGTPLGGASISVRFNNQLVGGTSSDDAGNFVVPNLETGRNYTVEASLIGHQTITQSASVNSGSNQITLTLTSSSTGMQEVVVTALGIKRAERSLGYAVTQLKAEEVATNKTINIQSALAGKVAGMDIGESANGLAGSKRVVIRGISTISASGNSSPLWVIDGVPISSNNFGRNNDAGGGIDYGDGLSMLNPDNIESVSVLKGNAAAALYGSRASNGVILVTTKTGKSSRKDLVVELNSSVTNSRVVDMTNWQYEYGQGRDGKRPVSQQEALVTGASSWGEKMDGKPTVQFDGVERPYAAQKRIPAIFIQMPCCIPIPFLFQKTRTNTITVCPLDKQTVKTLCLVVYTKKEMLP